MIPTAKTGHIHITYMYRPCAFGADLCVYVFLFLKSGGDCIKITCSRPERGLLLLSRVNDIALEFFSFY